MLSYIHSFHAGNHADILKHFVLTYVLNYLNKKEKPYTFFDTHAGNALYDLTSQESLKTQEAQNGVLRLFNTQIEFNSQEIEQFKLYEKIIAPFLEKNLYPGSPLIEKTILRATDTLIVSELHPECIKILKNNLKTYNNEPKIQIHNRNGFEMLKALTPPVTKRGGVLIDPSYETLQDFLDVADTVNAVNKKWNSGIILIWYPLIKSKLEQINQMKESIINGVKKNNANAEFCDLQLCVNSPDSHIEMDLKDYEKQDKKIPRLYGSGMLIVNTPWKLEEECKSVISAIEAKLKMES